MSGTARPSLRIAGWIGALVVLFAAIALWEKSAKAQPDTTNQSGTQKSESPEDPASDDKEEASDNHKTLGMMVVESGWFSVVFYVLLGIFSMFALVVTLERLTNLKREKVMPSTFVMSLKGLIQRSENNPDEFRRLCETSETPVSRILKAAVLRVGRPLPEVEKSMEDAVAREMAEMRSRSRPLGIIGNIAPLVGLLGTVVGMIFAFSTASRVGLGRADELAKGIYLALMTTAGGLTIAIPALLFAAWFNGRAERYIREIDETLLETMPCFASMENRIIETRIPAQASPEGGPRELEPAEAT
jgi:biopolymer transport protein ExbB